MTASSQTARVRKLKTLPPISGEGANIINAVNNPDIDIDELVSRLSVCPVLVARLIGLANSSYFGRVVPVTDLKAAVIQVLGFKLVKSLSLSLVLNGALQTDNCPHFDAEYYWCFGLTRALLAQKLASKSQDELLEQAVVYTSALLMDIGALAAINVAAQEMDTRLGLCDGSPACVAQQIKAVFGVNLYNLGYILLERWHMPAVFVETLKALAQAGDIQNKTPLVRLLYLSQQLTGHLMDENLDNLCQYQAELLQFSWDLSEFETVINTIEQQKKEIRELASIIQK